VRGAEIVGLASFAVSGSMAELLTLDALEEDVGIGGALVGGVVAAAESADARQLVLSTTTATHERSAPTHGAVSARSSPVWARWTGPGRPNPPFR